MFVSTTDVIPGVSYQILGLVQGNVVTSRHIGRDLMAGVKSIVGGEIKTFTDMTSEARLEAERRMVAQAQAMGADAVIASRFASDTVAEGTIEMLAYGTAVKFIG
ncbi:MAG: YbjQ family protein [Coriobacteriia bacterium]|nr:YbjQ family protein [Coriobacteriia bacterium]